MNDTLAATEKTPAPMEWLWALWRRFGRYGWVWLLVVPLLLALAWGPFFEDQAYELLRYAQNILAGRGLNYDTVTSGYVAPLRSPLYVLELVVWGWIGLPLPAVALVLGALGWGAASLSLLVFARASGRPFAGLLAAFLLSISPILFSSAGLPYGWVMALILVALHFTVTERWRAQTMAMAVLLGLHLDLSTLFLAAALWTMHWRREQRIPWRSALLLLAVGGGWLAFWQWQWARLFLQPELTGGEWGRAFTGLVRESELYWLYLPFFGLGLLARKPGALWLALAWWFLAAVTGSALAGAVSAVMVTLLSGLSLEVLAEWAEAGHRVRLQGEPLRLGLVLLVALALATPHVSALRQRFEVRPVSRWRLEAAVAGWLESQSEPGATLFALERLGYLADRPLVPDASEPINLAQVPAIVAQVSENPPDYFVTANTIGWDFLKRTGWFRARYAQAESFASHYEVSAPYEIWAYQQSAFDLGDTLPLNVRSNRGIDVVGYRYWPERFEPGEAVQVTLFMQATEPLTTTFNTVVRVVSPVDGVAYAQRDEPMPQSVPISWWEPGQIVAERFVLTTTAEIPPGAYALNFSLRETGVGGSFWPLFQNNDANALDRVFLGYAGVPWQGDPADAVAVGALFGGQIRLAASALEGRPAPGDTLTVKLYWEALERLDEAYVVFVHLLDENGNLVASDDRPPQDGRFPTAAWIAGDRIEDAHSLTLPIGLAPGSYHVRVGLYLPDSGERLPTRDAAGADQPDRTIRLPGTVEVR